MTTQTTPCTCTTCPGPQCTCGCQPIEARPAAASDGCVACTCGDACRCSNCTCTTQSLAERR